MTHRLLDVLTRAARGEFPPVDGAVTLLEELSGGNRAIVAFTGHAYIAADLVRGDLEDLALDGFGAAMSPEVMLRVADGGEVGVNDVILAARGTGAGMTVPVTSMWDDHARVRHARHLRDDVQVFGDRRGFVTVGSGLAGRREVSIEIAETDHSAGLGRQLVSETLGAVSPDDHLFAAVAPGNARSLRSFLAAGFRPLGSEVIIDRSAVAARSDD